MNQPNTSIFPPGIGVSVDVSLFQLHRLYSALPCYRALRPYMYFYVHVHVHLCARYEVYFAMWTYLIPSVLSEPLCSEDSAAPLARCGKYRGISNYLVVSLLHIYIYMFRDFGLLVLGESYLGSPYIYITGHGRHKRTVVLN